MKTKTKIILILAMLIIGAIIFAYFRMSKGEEKGFKTIVDTCNVIGSGTVQKLFKCPSKCQVYGFKTCSNIIEAKKVVFRTNAMSFADYSNIGTWIAINCIPSGKECISTSDLKGYCSSSSTISTLTNYFKITPTGNRIYVWNSILYIEGEQFRKYASCTTADLTLNPKEPYISNNQELYSGLNLYQCQTPAYIDGNKVETAIYSSEKSGDYSTNVYNLNSSQEFSFDGSINYAILDSSLACVVDTCNEEKTGFYECNMIGGCPQKSNILTSCPSGEYCAQKSTGATCEIPFSITSSFQDSEGKTKTAFTLDELIYFNLLINSNSQNSATITASLLDSQDMKVSPEQIKTINFPNTIPWIIKFNAQNSTGSYKLLLKIKFIDKTVERFYEIRVSNPISISVRAFSEQGTTLYSNQPSNIELRVFDDSGNPTTSNTNLLAKLNGKILVTPQPEIKTLGTYQYSFNLAEDGLFNVEATAEKFGYITRKNAEFIVQPVDIKIEFKNIEKLGSIDIGTKTIEFTTKNPQGDLINTNNDVSVILPSGIVQKLTNIQGSSGQYSFVFNFDKEGGYKIKVRSTSIGFMAKEQETPFINVVEGTPTPDCFENDDCGLGKECIDGKCKDKEPFNWLLVIILIFGILSFATFTIILIIILRKRRTR